MPMEIYANGNQLCYVGCVTDMYSLDIRKLSWLSCKIRTIR